MNVLVISADGILGNNLFMNCWVDSISVMLQHWLQRSYLSCDKQVDNAKNYFSADKLEFIQLMI